MVCTPAPNTKLPGPFKCLSLLTVRPKPALGHGILPILDPECTQPSCSWSLPPGFVTLFGIFFSPGAPSRCLEHSRSGQTSGLWLQPVAAAQNHRPFLTTSLTTSHQHLKVMCPWQLWSPPNSSTRETQHLLSAPWSLLVPGTEGRRSFKATVLIYETCLWIWLLTAVALTE